MRYCVLLMKKFYVCFTSESVGLSVDDMDQDDKDRDDYEVLREQVGS